MIQTEPRATPASLSGASDAGPAGGSAHLHAFDIAHVVMLTESGIVPPGLGAAIIGLLVEVARGDIHAARAAAGGDGHAGERLVSDRLGVMAGDHLGLARGAGEIAAVGFRLGARAWLLQMMEAVYQLREALIRFAERHAADLVVVGGHAQPAEPTTFGHWALMIDSGLTRDSERLVALYNRMNRSPAGAGILAGLDFPVNRLRTAELLGFDGLVENTCDAVMSRDMEMEFAATLTFLAQTVARLADDLMPWSAAEVGIARLPGWFCGEDGASPGGGSPRGLLDIRDLAARAMGGVTAVIMAARGPTGFNPGENRACDAALRDLSAGLLGCLPLLARALDGTVIDAGRGLALARRHWSTAPGLAALFVRENGLAWRHARALAGDIVQDALARGISPAGLTAADVARVAQAAGETDIAPGQAAIDAALDPVALVRRRETLGGPGPEVMAGGLVSAQARIRLGRSRLADRHRTLDAAADRRMAAAEAVISGRFPAAGE